MPELRTHARQRLAGDDSAAGGDAADGVADLSPVGVLGHVAGGAEAQTVVDLPPRCTESTMTSHARPVSDSS